MAQKSVDEPSNFDINNDRVDNRVLLIVFIFLLTIAIPLILSNFTLKKNLYNRTRADNWYLTPSPNPAKSCNINLTDPTATGCDFYESCINSFCQYNSNWSNDITPIQALAIYDRLKTDLGIDIPLIMDKDRVSKLQDGGIIVAGTDSPCASSFIFDTTGINLMSCLNQYNNNPDFKKAQDSTTLHGILRATYPDLNDSDINTLEQKLKLVMQEKAPGALLERVGLYIDIVTIPALVKDIGSLGIKGLKTLGEGGKEVLPQILNVAKNSRREFSFSIDALKELQSFRSYSEQRLLDFGAQMTTYLRSIDPYRYITYKGNTIPIWRARQVFSSTEALSEFATRENEAFKLLYSRFGKVYVAKSSSFVDNMARFGYPDARGLYIPSIDELVILAKEVGKGAQHVVEIEFHETTHQLLRANGLRNSVDNILGRDFLVNYPKYEAALHEGMTQVLTENILNNKLGYGLDFVRDYSYAQQREALLRLINRVPNGNVDWFTDILTSGDFNKFLKATHWDANTFREWVLGHIKPVSKLDEFEEILVPQVAAVSYDSSNGLFGPNMVTDSFVATHNIVVRDSVEDVPLNRASYSLVGQLNDVINTENLSEIALDDIQSLKLLLAGSYLANNIAQNGSATYQNLDDINNNLENLQIEKYVEVGEYGEDLPEIGNDNIPIPQSDLTPTPGASPSVTQSSSTSCDDTNWYCGGECACPSTRTLFTNTYPGQDAASIWRSQKASTCGGACSSSCLQSPTTAPGWPTCGPNATP